MVSLMDRLLKLENLDLHLTPYRVLATGHDEGMLEFIPSKSLAQNTEVLQATCRNFFRMKRDRLGLQPLGYILGRDPKPFPPPMKLCKEMVEAMGGAERYTNIIKSKMPFSSLRFVQFCDFCPRVCFFAFGSKRFEILPFSSSSLIPSIFLC
ncbi:putative phosphatidylinositol 3-kinase [Helianthus anomalus]